MNFLSKSSTTNALLGVIAVTLAVQMVQNFSSGGRPSAPPMPMSNPHAMANPHGMPMSDSRGVEMEGGPAEGAPAGAPPPGMGMQAPDMDPAAMALASLSCPDDTTLTLDSPSCSGKVADERKEAVRGIVAKSESIRGIFDEVVKRFGEVALSPQAREIRQARMRRK